MYQLVFTSKATAELFEFSLLDEMDKIYKSNTSQGISGVILFDGCVFLQVLEGNAKLINELFFGKIMKDRRHKNINIIVAGSMQHAQYDGWNMMLLVENQTSHQIYQQFFGVPQFQPSELHHKNVHEFIQLLCENNSYSDCRSSPISLQRPGHFDKNPLIALNQLKKCGCCGLNHDSINKYKSTFKNGLYWFRCECNSTLVVGEKYIKTNI